VASAKLSCGWNSPVASAKAIAAIVSSGVIDRLIPIVLLLKRSSHDSKVWLHSRSVEFEGGATSIEIDRYNQIRLTAIDYFYE
jgi:hypothetical protein